MYFWKTALWWLIYNKLLIQSIFFFIGDFTISLKVEHCFWQFFKNTFFFCSRVMPLKTGFSLKITLTNCFKLQENKVLIFHKYLEKKLSESSLRYKICDTWYEIILSLIIQNMLTVLLMYC